MNGLDRIGAVLCGVACLFALRAPSSQATESTSWLSAPFWNAVARCETGGRWDWGARHRHGEGHSFEGGVGFAASTWRAWASDVRLLAKYPHAYQAPRLVQIAVAEYGYAHDGYWGCLN